MKLILCKVFFLCVLLCLSTVAANAQNQLKTEQKERNIIVVGAKKSLEVSGKVSLTIIKETSKIAWKTTEFTAKEVAAPIAKTIIVKAVPKVSVFLLKQSGILTKKTTPIASKLLVTYLKL